MEMTPSDEGGRGGKFRRPTYRRAAAATPYDRPPSAVRAVRTQGTENVGNGWISRLAGPASRLISGSASRLLGSVFRQAPIDGSMESENLGGNDLSMKEDVDVATNGSSHESQKDKSTDVSCSSDSNISNISEVEHLVKQKTFTRTEFDHLIEMIRSRTVDLDTTPTVKNEKLDVMGTSAPTNVAEGPSSTGDFSMQPYDSTIFANESASPEELAKAYMNSRVKTLVPSINLQGQVFHEQKIMLTTLRQTPESVAPSVSTKSVRFSSTIEAPEGGYLTPKLPIKSAMYRLPSSPYLKVHENTVGKDANIFKDRYTGPTPYFWTPKSTIPSSARQVLKRRSSILDDEVGSFGPIRRIRQKCMISPPKASSGILSPGSSSQVKESAKSVFATIQPDQLPGLNLKDQKQTTEKGENMVYHSSAGSVPPKSAETARKIFQHLDKLASSPNKKYSNPIVPDGSYSKARNVHGDNLPAATRSPTIGIKNILYEKQAKVKENGPSKSTVLGIKLNESSSKHTGEFLAIDAMPENNLEQHKKPVFQVSQAKDFSCMKKDNPVLKDALKKDVEVERGHDKAVSPESISTHLLLSSSMSPKLTNSNDLVGVSKNGAGFKFATALAPNMYSQTSQAHTTSSQVDESISIQKEKTIAPSFSFRANSTCSLVFSSPSIATGVNIPVAENGTMQKELTEAPLFNFRAKDSHNIVFLFPTINGSSDTPAISENGPSQLLVPSSLGGEKLDKGDEAQKPESVFMSSNKSALAPAVHAFGISHNENKSNGSLGLPSNDATGISQSSSNLLPSSFVAVSSKGTLFQFGPNKGLEEKNVKASPFGFDGSTSATSVFSKTEINKHPGVAKASESTSIVSVPAASATVSSIGYNSTGFSSSSISTIVSNKCTPQVSTITSAGTNIFTFGSPAQPSNSSLLVSDNSFKGLATTATASESVFGSIPTQSERKVMTDNSPANKFSSSPSNLERAETVTSRPLSSASLFSFSVGAIGSTTSIDTVFSQPGAISKQDSFINPFKSSAIKYSSGSGASPMHASFSTSSTSSSGSPFMFGLSTESQFSSTSASAFVLSSPLQQSVFQAPTTSTGQRSESPGNDQMHVEDHTNEETNKDMNCNIPKFDQSRTSPITPMHSIPTVQFGATPIFQFGSQQNSFQPIQSPALATNNSEFPTGGSFSMGSGGDEIKANRRIFKAKRKK